MGERVHRSVMNIKVGMLFYMLSLILGFVSRKIFLNCLGAEFIGLTGMLMNIMEFLSVAELGIGSSIVFFLYKPIQEDNHEKINEVMSMLAYLYRCIGLLIGALGLVTSFFFPWWFDNLSTGLPLVYFAFYTFLANTMVAYLFNYRHLFVRANQKQYLIQAYFQTITIVKTIVQILLAYYYRNLWLWLIVGLLSTIIGIIIFNYRLRKMYPWLHINLKAGKLYLKQYPEVLKKTRQIFIQKIKDFILYHCDEIFVGAFVSVVKVAYYGNYTMILNKLIYLVNVLSDGMHAGVGNLLAEGNEKNTMKVYWELTAARFFILGVIIFSLLLFIQPFISCWLGRHYQLEMLIVYLLIINIFIRLHYSPVFIFLSAAGLYADIWANWTELIINLALTLILAPTYGIAGILIGKIVSFFFISVFWKPYYLFSEGFHKSVWDYWRGMTPYYIIFALLSVLTLWLRYTYIDQLIDSFWTLIVYGAVFSIPLFALYFLLLFQFTKGMKYFVARKPAIYAILNRITF